MNDSNRPVRLVTHTDLTGKANELKQVAVDKTFAHLGKIAGMSKSTLPANAKQLIENGYAYIPRQFEYFLDGNPEQVGSVVAILEQVKAKLSDQARVDLRNVELKLKDWDGKAADQFREAFAHPFPAIAGNQANLAEVAIAGLRNYEQILLRMRLDAYDAAQGTIDALNSAAGSGDVALALAGAAVSFIGSAVSVMSGGALAPVMFTMLSGTISVAGPGAKYIAAGKNPADILNAMNQRLLKIRDTKNAEAEHLSRRLREDLRKSYEETAVGSNATTIRKLVAPRPLLIDLKPEERKTGFYRPGW